jgi:hypothetical protein
MARDSHVANKAQSGRMSDRSTGKARRRRTKQSLGRFRAYSPKEETTENSHPEPSQLQPKQLRRSILDDNRDSVNPRVALDKRLKDWLNLFNHHIKIHGAIRAELLNAGLITAVKGNPLHVQVKGSPELEGETKEGGDLTPRLLSQIEDSLFQALLVEKDTSPAIPADVIQGSVNGISMNLHFKNSGNNDINDIETYLQEKLDVLEFIQMDCNKMDVSQLPAASRLYRPPPAQLDKSSYSVADWYTTDKQSIPVSESDSFPESVHVQRSHLKELADDGFFIGTPTGRIRTANLLPPSSPNSNILDQSELEWETSSVVSPRRGKGRSFSRRRSMSNSSVSSVDSSQGGYAPPKGMFMRGRMERLTANISGYSEDSAVQREAPEVPFTSSWW